MASALRQKRRVHRRSGQTEPEAETGVLKPRAGNVTFLEAWSHRELDKAGRGPPRAPGGCVTTPTPRFQTSGPQNCETMHFSCFKPPSYGAISWWPRGWAQCPVASACMEGGVVLWGLSGWLLSDSGEKPAAWTDSHVSDGRCIDLGPTLEGEPTGLGDTWERRIKNQLDVWLEE